jgi:hypothetical protein
MNNPIETASELYREMKRRGLHLRKNNGRDNVLLEELEKRLGCPSKRLQSFLGSSEISAERFLKVFLEIAQPFAQMFSEIWDYLSLQFSPKAHETISIRFGFQEEETTTITLEQFRRYVEIISTIKLKLWPIEALHKLFGISRILVPKKDECFWVSNHYDRYNPGYKYELPAIQSMSHPFDQIMNRIRGLFQSIINEYASEYKKMHEIEKVPEINTADTNELEYENLRNAAYLLTDLLPVWTQLFNYSNKISFDQKSEALRYYKKEIEPILTKSASDAQVKSLRALDILDLPFWKHRWHTYEIWSTILILQILEDYRPTVNNLNGYIPIDGFSSQVISHLRTKNYPDACVAIQVQTSFTLFRRKAIKPDLRICFSNNLRPEETALIIEFKQHCKIKKGPLKKIARDYLYGSPNCGAVIIINYDETTIDVPMPPNCFFISGVNPNNKNKIEIFKKTSIGILRKILFLPEGQDTAVLLDISGSMRNSYLDRDVQFALKKLINMKWVRVFRFNNGLVSGCDLDEMNYSTIRTSGGTQLGQAIMDIEKLFGLPKKILIVTDGAHDHPKEILQKIPSVKECTPMELENNISWL